MEHMVANMQRFLQGLHAEGVFLHFLHAEEVRGRTSSQHQIIILDFPVVGQEYIAGLVNALGFRHEEFHVGVLPEESADRISDFICRQYRRGYLVQQRLKQVIVMTVYQSDLHIIFRKQFCQFDAAKACAYYNDTRFLICH